MILPWLRGFLDWQKVPMTWTLVVLNLLFFMITHDHVNTIASNFLADQRSFELTARLYQQYKKLPETDGHSQLILLGYKATKDFEFMQSAETFPFVGDQIEIKQWQADLKSFHEYMDHRPVQIFGLSWNHNQALTWITYQFMHASWLHLFGNMMLLLIFAAAVEIQSGGLALIFIYILSGVAGAFAFLTIGAPTLAPMIGASGSLSGLMAFYAVFERRKHIPFIFFLSPLQGYFGKIYLPTWMIFPLFFVSDIAAFFSSSRELGHSVAYSAHIGGMIFGLLVGLFARQLKAETHYSL